MNWGLGLVYGPKKAVTVLNTKMEEEFKMRKSSTLDKSELTLFNIISTKKVQLYPKLKVASIKPKRYKPILSENVDSHIKLLAQLVIPNFVR